MISLFDEDQYDFINILNKYQVEYILVGGIAVSLHGYARGTNDMDIWIGSTVDNKKKLISAIEEFGYDSSDYQKKDPNEIIIFSLGSRNQPGHIELMNRIAGIKFEDAYLRAETKDIDGILIKLIHIDDLIKNKLASARHRDLDDVENLNKLRGKTKPD